MSVRDLIEADVSTIFRDRDGGFAETLTYRAAGERSARRVIVLVWDRQRTTDDQAHHLLEAETCDFFVSDDPAEGMPDPRLGDRYELDGDPTREGWDFVSRRPSPGGYDVRIRKRIVKRAGHLRPAQL